MKTTTRQEYQRRLLRVMNHIHQNLDRELDVNALASIALMSPYHFHRIYREMAMEPVNATVRRLRLQKAASLLIRDDIPIAKIAKQSFYGSVEAFSRAFSQQFGETPLTYRQRRQQENVVFDQPFVATFPEKTQEFITMFDVEIIETQSMSLAGYSHQGDYMEIGQKFEALFIYASANQLLNENTRSIGIYEDDPKSVATEDLRSMACITLDEHTPLTGENKPDRKNIPAMTCATVIFKGAYAELEKPYDWLFGQWLPQSGYEPGDFPAFEEYLNDPKETPPSELLTKIHCPLKA